MEEEEIVGVLAVELMALHVESTKEVVSHLKSGMASASRVGLVRSRSTSYPALRVDSSLSLREGSWWFMFISVLGVWFTDWFRPPLLVWILEGGSSLLQISATGAPPSGANETISGVMNHDSWTMFTTAMYKC